MADQGRPGRQRPDRLVAAFNSAFRLKDSHGGVYAGGRTHGKLQPGAASLVIDKQGTISVGAWGSDVSMTPDVAAVRQNLSLLVSGGQVVPGIQSNNAKKWGATIGNAYYVWRSGIGVTATGAAVYVAGDRLSGLTLAQLLQRAGAVRAMELDINPDWTSFIEYRSAEGRRDRTQRPAGHEAPAQPVRHDLVTGLRGALPAMTTLEVLRTRRTSRELLRALRPRQWPKNLLVFAAPMAAGDLVHPRVLGLAVLAFVSFTLAAASTYLLNDVMDATADRLHPDKRLRPVAAGTLSARTAVRMAVVGAVLAAVTAALHGRRAADGDADVQRTTLAYAHSLKRVAGVEIVIVASGFVLRPLAGAFATGDAPSAWFLAVCCLSAIALTIGKRLAELVRLGASHRTTGPRSAGTPRGAGPRSGRDGAADERCVRRVGHGADATAARVLDLLSLLPVLAAFATVGA